MTIAALRSTMIQLPVRDFTPAELTSLWDAISQDHLARSAFFSFRADDPTNDERFKDLVYGNQGNFVLIINATSKAPLALYWAEPPLGHVAMMHFTFFKGEGYTTRIQACELALRTLRKCGYSAMAGLTPTRYRHVLRFIERELHWTIHNTWPRVFYFADKDRWEDGVLSQFIFPPEWAQEDD